MSDPVLDKLSGLAGLCVVGFFAYIAWLVTPLAGYIVGGILFVLWFISEDDAA